MIGQIIINGLLNGCVYALVAVGLSLTWGVMDIVNFAHGEFLLWGLYASFWIWALMGLDPLISMPIVIVLIFLLGVLTYLVVIKRVLKVSGLTALLATFGLSMVLKNLTQFFWTANYRNVTNTLVSNRSFKLLGMYIRQDYVVAAAGALIITLLVTLFLNRTKTGIAIKATSINKSAAQLVGIDTNRIYAITFGLSGADAAYYACQTVRIPARILPREVVITPRPNMGKTFNDEPFRDPVFKQGTLLFKNITDPDSPYYVDVSGVPGYGVPVFTDSDREVLKLLATEAVLKSRPMFPGWLSREAGEDVGSYRITIGDMDFGDNFTVTLGEEYFTITPRSLDDAAITADPIPDQAYTGKYLKPVPNLEYDGETMIAGKDFTLAYSNNKKPGE
ncbi:MAG: branched-chain amino acid ABC transporter permease, partial [Firmicutes bacterium]|nr:branched-chain amino acid ABC transporter permease [Bacillota bacterium]